MMKNPINNEYLENLANKIADSITSEDSELYAYLMANSESFRYKLKRWELLAFRDRVHYLANNPSQIKV